MKKKNSFILVLLLTTLEVFAQNEKTKVIHPNGQIRFENINPKGSFIEYKTFTDPLSKSYKVGPVKANGKSPVKTVFGTRSPKNRVDIAFVGDGYTRADLAQYLQDAEIITGKIIEQEPYKTYRNYLSFHRVDVISEESGVDNDPQGSLRNTALDMEFDCFNTERLLCVNAQKAKEYAANAPGADIIFALANAQRYGGAGYWDDGIATLSARNEWATELALHEVGHSFGQLGDEYTDFALGRDSCIKKENASNRNKELMLERKLKWYRWFDMPHIGTFPGVCYSSTGFRPTNDSKMRTLGRPFEEVNSEQLIFKFYEHVKPIDNATPEGTYPQGTILQVAPMQPIGHDLSIQWYANGKLLQGQTGRELDTSKVKVTFRPVSISVEVIDNTDKVRNELKRQMLMKDKRSWMIKKRFSR